MLKIGITMHNKKSQIYFIVEFTTAWVTIEKCWGELSQILTEELSFLAYGSACK